MGGTGDGGQGVIISYETHTHTHTHTHTFRVYGGDRGQGLGGTGVRGTRGYHII